MESTLEGDLTGMAGGGAAGQEGDGNGVDRKLEDLGRLVGGVWRKELGVEYIKLS